MFGNLLILSLVALAHCRPQKTSDTNEYLLVPDDRCPPTGTHHLLPHEYDCTKYYYCEYGMRYVLPRDCAPGTEFCFDEGVCVHASIANCPLPGPSTTPCPDCPPAATTTTTTVEPTSTPEEPTTTTEETTPCPDCPPCPICPTTTETPTTTTTIMTTTITTTTEAPTTTTGSPCPECPPCPDLTTTTTTPEPTTTTPEPTTTTPEPTTTTPEPTTITTTTPEPTTTTTTPCPDCLPCPECPTTTTTTQSPTPTTTTTTTEAPCTECPPCPDVTTLAPTTTTWAPPEVTLPNGCPSDFDISHLLPHETECGLYYQCISGELVEMPCAPGTYFVYELQTCEHIALANCTLPGTSTVPTTIDSTTTTSVSTTTSEPPVTLPNGCPADFYIYHLLPHETECDRFYQCVFGQKIEMSCAPGTHFVFEQQDCDHIALANCTLIGTSPTAAPSSTQTPCPACPTTTTEAPSSTCPDCPECPPVVDPCETECHVPHWPHETDCDKFWHCDGNKRTLGICSEGLLFNEDLQSCDFESSNVACIRRNIQSDIQKLLVPFMKIKNLFNLEKVGEDKKINLSNMFYRNQQ